MLIFRDQTSQDREPPRKPTAPIWSRRPENFSGEELIAEARVRADFIESKDALTASWLRAVIDQHEAQLFLSVTLAKKLESLQTEEGITIADLRRRLMAAGEDDRVSFDPTGGLRIDRGPERTAQQGLTGRGSYEDRLDRFIEDIDGEDVH